MSLMKLLRHVMVSVGTGIGIVAGIWTLVFALVISLLWLFHGNAAVEGFEVKLRLLHGLPITASVLFAVGITLVLLFSEEKESIDEPGEYQLGDDGEVIPK